LTDLPAERHAEFRALYASTRCAASTNDEYSALPETDAQVRATATLGSIPLAVLTATEHGFPADRVERMEQIHLAYQQDLAALSTNRVQHLIEGASHTSLLNNREQGRIRARPSARWSKPREPASPWRGNPPVSRRTV